MLNVKVIYNIAVKIKVISYNYEILQISPLPPTFLVVKSWMLIFSSDLLSLWTIKNLNFFFSRDSLRSRTSARKDNGNNLFYSADVVRKQYIPKNFSYESFRVNSLIKILSGQRGLGIRYNFCQFLINFFLFLGACCQLIEDRAHGHRNLEFN